MLDLDWFLGRLSDTRRIIPPLTIGWSGGVRDEADLDVVAEAWTRVAKRYPEVKFVVHGITPKILANAVPGGQLLLMAWTALPDYPRSLINIDIACCAVQDGPTFNAAKSPIKWMECSTAGSACVVSKAIYSEVVTHEKDGLICETVDEWDAALSKLIEDEEYRRAIAEQAQQAVREHHALNKCWPAWIEALAGILADGKPIVEGLLHAVTV
jgi:glycosyltransferase involved in cell wall biosynthesis